MSETGITETGASQTGSSQTAKASRKPALSREAMYQIIRSPVITEKATRLTEQGQMVFRVAIRATKPEIKAAIEGLFGVTVLAVFKPIRLNVADSASPGMTRILAGNADQSPFEAARVSNVQFCFTTDLGAGFANWVLCTNSILLTNGQLQCDFFTGGIVNGFWQAVEQP